MTSDDYPSPLLCRHFGNRPVCATLDADPVTQADALSLFAGTTRNRRLLAWCIRQPFLQRLGLVRCVRREFADFFLPPADLAVLLQSLQTALGTPVSRWLLVWPACPERRRLYLLFDMPVPGSMGVVKIGADNFNLKHMENEALALQRLRVLADAPFAFPQLLFFRSLPAGARVLALSGFPSGAPPLSRSKTRRHAAEVVAYLTAAGGVLPRMLKDTQWYKDYQQDRHAFTAARSLRGMESAMIDHGWAHGDLGPGNMLRQADGRPFLFDWENASAEAPRLTDSVALWLADRQKAALRHPRRMARQARDFFHHTPENDMVCALAFLHLHRNLAAEAVLQHWSQA